MQLTLLGSTVKKIVGYGANLYHFTEAGVDVHRQSDGVRIAWAELADVTCGAVNDNGVYLGTSVAGVHLLAHAAVSAGGDRTADLVQTYTTGSSPSLQSNQVNGLAGRGAALLVTGPAGADYLPSASTVHRYADADGCGVCAVGQSKIAYALASGGCHTVPLPTENWAKQDPYFPDVKLLLGFDINFADSSPNPKTVTAVGHAATTDAQKKYGAKSCVLDGTGDYLTVPAANFFDGAGDFTFECWVRQSAYAAGGTVDMIARCLSGSNGFNFEVDSTGKLGLWLFQTSTYNLSTDTIGLNTWAHVALTRASGVYRTFINGVLQATRTSAATIANATLYLGKDASVTTRDFAGYIDEVRITRVARYTANFTPPVSFFKYPDAVLSASAQPLILSDTIRDIAYGADLFIATDSGISIWDAAAVTDITTPLGDVLDVQSIHPTRTATATSGLLAYGTSDGEDGGRFGVLDLAEV